MEAKGSNGLKLHTNIMPEKSAALEKDKPVGDVGWRVVRRSGTKRSRIARKPRIRQGSDRTHRAPLSERLLRNTAVACALLLTVMAIRNLDTPFTNTVTDALSRVVSMDFRLDESLGKLSFVENIVPESALVFLNMQGGRSSSLPVEGEAVHEWSREQPWIEYITRDSSPVRSVTAGTVSACAKSDDGDWTKLISNNDGSQCVYAYLVNVSVKTGDIVERSSSLGETGAGEGARLYFEYRKNGSPTDPSSIMSSGRV